MPDEVFLSHSSEDQDFAESIASVVRGHNIPVWYSDTDITGSQQWHDEIGDALRRCDYFCVVLSQNSVDSMWVKRETLYALEQAEYEDSIAPIIIEDCDYERLSWVLSSIQMIDFRDDFEQGCRDLMQVWGVGLRQDVIEPHT